MKLSLSAVIILFATTISLIAQPKPYGDKLCGKNADFMKRELAEKLNLSDEQKEAIAELKLTMHQEILDLTNKIEKNRIEVKKLLLQDKLDRDEITSIIKENSDLQSKIKLIRTENWFKIYDMLDTLQKPVFKKTFGKFLKGMHGRKHHNRKNSFGYGTKRRYMH